MKFNRILSMKQPIIFITVCIVAIVKSDKLPPDTCHAKDFSENCKISEMADGRERIFIMIKPDGVQRGLVGKVISRFEEKGFKLIAMKFHYPSVETLREHYAEHVQRPFFPGLVSYMQLGPVVPMVWEGKDAVKACRALIGATDPNQSAPGTIRGDYALHIGRNIVHGSSSIEDAEREIKIWFTDKELNDWSRETDKWLYEF